MPSEQISENYLLKLHVHFIVVTDGDYNFYYSEFTNYYGDKLLIEHSLN